MDNKALKQQIGVIKKKIENWFENQANPREKVLILSALVFCILMPLVKGYDSISALFSEQQQRLIDIETKQRAFPYRLYDYLQLESQKNAMEQSYKAIHSSDTMMSELEQLLQSKDKIRQGFTISPKKSEKFAGKYDMLPFKLNFDITDYSQLVELLYDLSVGKTPTIIRSITIQKASNNWQLRVSVELSGLTQTK